MARLSTATQDRVRTREQDDAALKALRPAAHEIRSVMALLPVLIFTRYNVSPPQFAHLGHLVESVPSTRKIWRKIRGVACEMTHDQPFQIEFRDVAEGLWTWRL